MHIFCSIALIFSGLRIRLIFNALFISVARDGGGKCPCTHARTKLTITPQRTMITLGARVSEELLTQTISYPILLVKKENSHGQKDALSCRQNS